jgi:DNA-binding IclR family transcriptional regulator
MASSDELAAFIASSFRSVWALELLLLLKRENRTCATEELVALLRASPSVVEKALDALISAGLAGSEEGEFAYMPVNGQVASLVEDTEQLYRSRPDRVRRLIVASSNKGLAAFSDAFRLKD